MIHSKGILPSQAIASMARSGAISAPPLDDDQVQPSSLDLRLGERAYRVRASFLPNGGSVSDRLRTLSYDELDLSRGAVLETGCVYLVPLLEGLSLPYGVSASANPKSSTGRIDVFTRLVAEGARAFDQVPDGYKGGLWAEISPRTFPVIVRRGSRLSQIRFRTGDARMSDAETRALDAEHPLVGGEVGLACVRDGLVLTIDLEGEGTGSVIGYRARRHSGVVDVDVKGGVDAAECWEPIHARPDGSLVLDPEEFYILASRESVHVPADTAAEMVAIDPTLGEFRAHYAGFFDPGFGSEETGGSGSRAVLEVRSRDLPFVIDHGQDIGRLVYERMSSRPDRLYGAGGLSNYQKQGLRLAKTFR